ncbi:Crp/Fnr family transcriptional regulator [Rhodothermus marinus]|uniref:Crp/Fnr family transcriptional regulator n=1 Tax=Rhodothermus marinus TaxID=29549 RepID=UPI0037C5CBCE
MPAPDVARSCLCCCVRQRAVFDVLDEKALTALDEGKHGYRFRKRQPIFLEGERPRGVYCVHEGAVKVYRLSADGQEQILRLARPGDLVGYRSLLCHEAYRASAEALTETHLCFIPADLFFDLVRRHVELSLRLLEYLSHDLAQAEFRLVQLTQKPVRERVAELLLLLAETFGTEADGQTLALPLRREDLASLAGTTPETLIRTLAALEAEGLIAREGRRLRLLRPEALASAAALVD